MLWVKRVKAKLKGVDDFYVDLRFSEIGAYQQIFDHAIRSIDIETETAWSRSEEYDREKFDRDENTIHLLVE